MYTLAICEDDPLQLTALRGEVAEIMGVCEQDILCFSCADSLMQHLHSSHTRRYIFLLDICLGEKSGIELARKLNEVSPNSPIIYVTGFLQYAPEVYETQHVYFVLKTQLRQKLPLALQKAEACTQIPQQKPILIQGKGRRVLQAPEDILYFERSLRKTLVHCQKVTHTTYQTFGDFIENLPQNSFVQCHKSFIVNLQYVEGHKRTSLALKSGVEIPISRNYEIVVNEALLQYLSF